MPDFGEPREKRPERVDDLIGGELMSRIEQMDVTSRKVFAGKLQGERRSKKRGQSVEFADYRQYTHGDDLRFIDWNVYARLDRLFLKMFLEEEDLALLIAIDTSASMHYGNPSKFVYAQRVAMALGYVGLVNRNRVSLFAYNDRGVQPLPDLRGRRRTREMGAWLLDLEPAGGTGFEEAMRTIALARRGKGVLVVLSDFLLKEGYEKGLRYVAGGGFDVFCLQLLSPEEIDPGAQGLSGDLRLVDAEDGDESEVTISAAVLQRYRENLDAWCGGLKDFCVRRGINCATVDTSTELETLMLEYLRQRGLLR